jgi:ATP-dependent exoDNAse (exonuclease V) beta subunit
MFYNKYGIITPYYNEGIGDTIYKYLVSYDYVKEEISEKIRLLYVAFTRAKEKMILVCDLNGEIFAGKDENGVLENNVRLKYKSFLDMIISIKNELGSYITKIEDISNGFSSSQINLKTKF